MPLINHVKKEINVKVVYAGAAFSGKGTNLQYIYGKLKESSKGSFKSMNLQQDRMLFFDFLPISPGSVNGYTVRCHLYTLTGDVVNPSSWKMVLKGLDGLVIVADSRPEASEANRQSVDQARTILASLGRTLAELPHVLQCNRRGESGSLPCEQVASNLGLSGVQAISANAATGEGVLDTVLPLVKAILKRIRESGVEVDEQPEELMRVEPQAAEAAVVETDFEAPAEAPVEGSGAVAALPAIAPGEAIRVPLKIRCGDGTKEMILTISLSEAD